MNGKTKYSIVTLDEKHQQLASWLGPVWRGMGQHARFEDGVGDQPAGDAPAADTPPSSPSNDTQPPSNDDTPPSSGLLDTAGLINPDGSFVADWHNSDLLPEGVRGSDSLGVIKNLSDLAKRTVHAESMIGKNKIALPKDGASEDEMSQFWAALGQSHPDLVRPAAASEYSLDIPEDMAEYFPEERIDGAKEFAHKIGISKTQFNAYMQNEFEVARQVIAESNAEQQRVYDENVLALKQEWGEAYLERQHVVKRVIAEAFGAKEAEKNAFLQKFSGDPDFVRFAANIGERLVESKALVAELTQDTPGQANTKIAELRKTPGYLSPSSDMSDERRTEITNQIREQTQIAHPEQRN